MDPRAHPLGIPRHMSSGGYRGGPTVKPGPVGQGRGTQGKIPHLPPLSRWSCKCNSLGNETWREHHQPKGSAMSHLKEISANPCEEGQGCLPLGGRALSLRVRTRVPGLPCHIRMQVICSSLPLQKPPWPWFPEASTPLP